MRFIIFTLLSIFSFQIFAQSPGCPQITPIGATICQGQCANLTATVVANNGTGSYAVSSIPYTPYAYTGGTGVSVGVDDVWSGQVNLGFNFCFFGTSYNRVWLGSNGQLCFTSKTAGSHDAYPVNAGGALPSTANTPANTINVFRDIDPSEGGNIRYYIGGTAPCRYLVYYYKNVPLYQCGNPESTFQMVLYENTNYIDIYIQNSSGSCGWQGGRGIVGIQNANASVAVVAPGRNSNNGNWTAVNEAWRFTPTGVPNYVVTWYGPGNTIVGTGLGPINVCPTTSTTYTASMVVTNCDGAQTTYTNTALVTVNNSPTVTIAPTATLNCIGNTTISTTVTPASTYAWSGSGIVSGGGTGSPSVNQPGVYTVSATAGGCTRTASITVAPPGTAVVTVNSPGICSGGTAVLTASGASTYTWFPGATSTNPLNVNPSVQTTYTVIGTAVGGCTGTATSTVSINPNPSATLSFTNASCGVNNGIIIINNTSSGGQTVSSFTSNLGSISGQTVTGLSAGSPVITLTNNFGCTFTVSTPISATSGPSGVTISPTNATCGSNNGSFTFGTPVGGTSPYTYAINGGAFSAVSPTTGLAPGTYSVTVRDATGCVFTNTTSILNVPGPTAIAGTATPAGCGLTNGTYNITGVTGGTAVYTFSLDGVSTGSLTSNLASGSHVVLVKDANNCTYTTTINVTGITGPATANVTTGNASCGIANGTAIVSGVIGGTPTYSFSFDGGMYETIPSAIGLLAGNHEVTIKDVNTCTLSVPFTVLNNGSPTSTVTGFTNPLCSGSSNGSFSVSASGGSGAPFSYTLTSPFSSNTTGVFSGLPAGTYNINVKDATGCTTTASVTLTNPLSIAITATALPVRCNGTASGTVNVTGFGGTPTYSYNLNGGAYQSSTIFANQFAGTYVMGIRDINGCTSTQTVTIVQPSALTMQVATQNANCTAASGVATTTVSGGTPVYTYTWTGGGGSAATSNGIVAGNYTVTATDANGCVIASPVVIGLTPGGTASITGSNNITCFNAGNGSLTAGMTGGAAPFTYSWSPGGQTAATAINLTPGTYTCVVTDFFGCKSSVVGTITQPPVLTAIMNSNNVKCFGTATGTVSAAGSGGLGPYTYLWSPTASTLSTVPNVAIGNYSCTIRDVNGCSVTQTITVTQPTSLTLTSSVTAANCNLPNGSATVTASGGAPGAYTYSWSAGSTTASQGGVVAGTYTILVTDANNCSVTLAATIPNTAGPTLSISSQTNVSCFGGSNGVATTSVSGGVAPYIYLWNHGAATAIATNLLSGIYTVTVTDQAGCIASASVNIAQPSALTVNILPTNPKCFGASNGFGVASALGGTPGYIYTWSDGGSLATSNQLSANNYGLIVTDANGCVVSSSMTLTNPPVMSASITSTNVTCFNSCNGTAVASSTNGVGAVTYYWTGGSSPISSQILNNACAGSYTLLATDQNSCSASAQITITQPTAVTANISLTGSVTCNGGNNGFAEVVPSGGTGAYTYSWSPNGGSNATATALSAGVYVVTVRDNNLCPATATATIIQPMPLTTTLTTTNPKCFGICDGTGNVAFSGGAGATTFLWFPGLQSGNNVNNLCAGNQTVVVTSNGSCTTSVTFTLTEPAALTAVASASNSNCGQNNGRACAVAAGGTAPLSYLWSNGAVTLCNNNLLAGAYTFTVTDFNGCTALTSGLVIDIEGPVVAITSTASVKCFGGNDGAATATITGGVSPYTISWTGSQATSNNTVTAGNTSSPVNFGSGLHNITVTDNAGCVGNAAAIIPEPTQLTSAIGSFTNVTCNGLSNGGATMLVNGGTAPYTYSWTPSAQTTSIMINVPANTYSGVVRDFNGCLTSQQVTITQPPALVLPTPSFTNITCFGANNGQIAASPTGGSPSYTYSWTPTIAGNSGVVSGLAPGGYSLTVIDANNCSIGVNIAISEPLVLTSGYTSLPATCGQVNGSATITINGGTPGYNVVWNVSGTPTGTVAGQLAPGNSISANITDSKGCTITQTVNVNAAPSPSITGYASSQPSCFGLTNGEVSVSFVSGTAPYTITWSNPISQTITTSALSQTIVGVGAGLYTATVKDNNGCITSQGVSVAQPPILTLSVSANQTICYGQSTQIYAQGNGGSPAYSYTWTNGSFTGGGPHTVNPTNTATYNVTVGDTKGCTTSPKIVTVNVSAPLSAIGGAVSLCHNVFGILTPTIPTASSGNGGPYTYTWTTPPGGNSNSISYTGNAPSVSTTNTVAVTVSDGCTIPNAVAVFTITSNPLPIATFTADVLEGCAPTSVIFTATSNNPSTDTYSWVNDNDKEIMGTTNPVTYNFTRSDSFTVVLEVTSSFGCVSRVVKNNYITIFPTPVASFYAEPASASILEPTINFINTTQGATNFYWDFGDPAAINGTNNSTLFSPSHYYNYVGVYKVNLVATSIKGCKDIVERTIEITPDFAIYIPNAFTPDGNGKNDVFQPLGVGIDEDNYRMDIFDRWGENIFTSNKFNVGWDGTVKGKKLAEQGVYVYKITVIDTRGGKHPYVGHVTVLKKEN